MVGKMEKNEIIRKKQEGKSNRKVSRETGFDRDAASKYWTEYQRQTVALNAPGADIHAVQESLFAKPEYHLTERPKRKYNDEIEKQLRKILESERKKTRTLGVGHKQGLTNTQIHAKVVAAGHDISLCTINVALARIRKRLREVFYPAGVRAGTAFGVRFRRGTA